MEFEMFDYGDQPGKTTEDSNGKEIGMEELLEAVKRLKCGKIPSWDKITADIIKHIG